MEVRVMRLHHIFTLVYITAMPLGVLGAGGDSDSLRGLDRIAVVVEDLHAEAENAGLSRAQLQTAVELRLRLAGIKVVDESEGIAKGYPFLYAQINNGERFYSIHVAFEQSVFLQRNTDIRCMAVTWTTESAGSSSPPRMAETVRKAVADHVDEFINAYLSVNPK
jgi:hypothetical protein